MVHSISKLTHIACLAPRVSDVCILLQLRTVITYLLEDHFYKYFCVVCYRVEM